MASASDEQNEDNFPQKLWYMVEDKNYDEIIWWNKGGDGFQICKDHENFLASKILQVYKFKTKNYSSFERQLNSYGFHKRKNGKKTEAYYHDRGYFNKNQPQLSKIIKRKKKQGTDSGVSSEPENCQSGQQLNQHGTLQEIEIAPLCGPLEGGTPFRLNNLEVDASVPHLNVSFGMKTVGVVREFGGSSWLGNTPPGERPWQTVTVKIEQPDGSELGKTKFIYMGEVNSEEFAIFLEAFQSQNAIQGSDHELINTDSYSLGLPKHVGQQQSVEIFQRLTYAAARIGVETFIRLVFGASVGRTAFEAYKNKSPLPEDIADAYRHEKIASYFRNITERFSKDNCTSQTQSKVVNWLKLVRAESELQPGPSETNIEELQKDDISETAYFGDTEASSPNSNEEISESDDEYKTVCFKDSVGKEEIFLRKSAWESTFSGCLPNSRRCTLEDDQEHPDCECSVPENVSLGNAETRSSGSGKKRSDPEDVSEGNHCKGLIPAHVRARGEIACAAYHRTLDRRAKVLLIGQDRLSKCLRGEPFDSSEPDEVQISFPVKKEKLYMTSEDDDSVGKEEDEKRLEKNCEIFSRKSACESTFSGCLPNQKTCTLEDDQGTESSKQVLACKMESNRHPPEVDINLIEVDKLPKKFQPWDDDQLPIDILLLTTKQCEFLSCISYLNSGFQKRYNRCIGIFYFGDVGKDEEVKLKLAVATCPTSVNLTRGSAVFVKKAIVELRPKAVFSVGCCGSLNRGIAKLGDVIVSAKLKSYAPTKVTGKGIQKRDNIVPLEKHLANLIRNVGDGWVPPLKNPSELVLHVHRDGVFLSSPEKVQSRERCTQLIQRFPEAVAIEMEGNGLFAAADDLAIDWIVIKGVSEYADGNNSGVEHWRRFASVMAASLTADILSDPVAFQSWSHYKGERSEHRPRDETVKVFPSSRPQVPTANVGVQTGRSSQDELEELSI